MKALLLPVLFLVVICSRAWAEEGGPADATFKALLAAEMSGDYDAFVKDGTTELKAGISKTQFDSVAALMNPKLKAGYDCTYLGQLRKSGNDVYLYRIRFTGGGDDLLGTLSLQDGKVSGIYFH